MEDGSEMTILNATGRVLSALPVLHSAAHPVTCIFHAVFKLLTVLVYLKGRYLGGSYVTCFAVSALLAGADFWTVKNVSGRRLVGLRWWNRIREDGVSEWIFESRHEGEKKEGVATTNATDYGVFWSLIVIWPLLWVFLLIINLISLSFDWAIMNVMLFMCAAPNLLGYWRCSKDAKKRAREWVRRQGVQVVAGAMGFA